jgi:hypothetical protein
MNDEARMIPQSGNEGMTKPEVAQASVIRHSIIPSSFVIRHSSFFL